MSIKIKLPDNLSEVTPFSFTMNSKELSNLVQQISATLDSSPSGSRSYLMLSYNKKLHLVGLSGDTYIILKVEKVITSANGCFAFDPKTLLGLIKNRSEMVFSLLASQELEFKLVKGRYTGKMVTLPITDGTPAVLMSLFTSSSEKDSVSLSEEELDFIKEGLNAVAVKDVFNNNKLLSYITVTKDKMSVSSFDNHHFGLYECSKSFKSPFSIATPISHFSLISSLSALSKDKLSFEIRSDLLKVSTDNFIVILPLTQANENNFGLVENFLKNLGKVNFESNLDIGKLADIADNLITLHSVNTNFNLSYKTDTDRLKVTYSVSASGSASDSIPIAKNKSSSFSVKVEPKVFSDVLTLVRSNKEASIQIKTDKCLVIKSKTKLKNKVTYVCSLV